MASRLCLNVQILTKPSSKQEDVVSVGEKHSNGGGRLGCLDDSSQSAAMLSKALSDSLQQNVKGANGGRPCGEGATRGGKRGTECC